MGKIRIPPPVLEALRAEIVPDPRGLVGFSVFALSTLALLCLEPGPDGALGGVITGCLPGCLRGPRADAVVEGLFQSLLLVALPASAYAGLRHLLVEGDSLLPYLTVAGAGSLTLILAGGLACSILG
jgi:hypothetical protein